MVTGRNGAGKSSLLRMIAGLVRIAAGQLILEGGDPDIPIAEQAHYLGHQDAMKPSLTVDENLQFWTGFLGARRNAKSALEAVDLAPLADLPAAYLSPDSGGDCRSHVLSPCRGRYGCLTNRPLPSTRPHRRGSRS